MAERFCACGSVLEEAADRLKCPGCGAEARAWLVRLKGEPVAAGSAREVYATPDLLREKLGLRQQTLDRADADDFAPPAGTARWARR